MWVHEHIGRRVAVHIVAEAGHIVIVLVGPTGFVVDEVVGRTVADRTVADHTAADHTAEEPEVDSIGFGLLAPGTGTSG